MKKLLLHTLVLSVIAFGTVPVLSHQAIPAEKKTTWSFLSWFNLQNLLRKEPPIRPRKGGSRDPFGTINDICMISPDQPNTTRLVWSDRPLFVWQGKVEKIAVYKAKNELWSQSVTAAQNISTYAGKQPLQPGQTYEWRVFFDDNLYMGVNFQIIDAQQRDRITTDLQKLENQLKAQGKDTEAIAAAKADYFAKNQLWSDVLQQVYSVRTPSDELSRFRKDIFDNLCNID